ncbi:MAG: ABC transporter permease [Chloroflexi bacterium]|nr:ABC transporter permease [Chloroflexota bacterium]
MRSRWRHGSRQTALLGAGIRNQQTIAGASEEHRRRKGGKCAAVRRLGNRRIIRRWAGSCNHCRKGMGNQQGVGRRWDLHRGDDGIGRLTRRGVPGSHQRCGAEQLTSYVAISANTFRWEWFRLRRRAGFWAIIGILGLFVAGTLAATIGMRFIPALGETMPAYGFPHVVFGVLSRLAPFLGIILAGLIFGGEFGWGTWRTSLARGMPASRLILVKILLGAVVLLAIWIIAWCLAVLAGLVIGENEPGGIIRESPGFPDGWIDAGLQFTSAWPVAVTYLALGALLCIIGRSTAFGIGVGIALIAAEMIGYPLLKLVAELIWEISLQDYLRWTLRGVTGGLLGNDEPKGIIFLPAALGYTALFCCLALAIFNRRDWDSGNG